jgi:hypothetical protein
MLRLALVRLLLFVTVGLPNGVLSSFTLQEAPPVLAWPDAFGGQPSQLEWDRASG